MKTNDSSHYNPLNPIWDLSYDPKGGSGILKAIIWVSIEGHDIALERLLAYTFSDTVNGREVECEKPDMPSATALEEDIYNSLCSELKFDTLNFITK